MILVWQTTENTTFPYIWCHGCEKPLEAGLSIQGEAGRQRIFGEFWLSLCPDCLDVINTFMRQAVLAPGPDYPVEDMK